MNRALQSVNVRVADRNKIEKSASRLRASTGACIEKQ
jgi:hypothetical protein